MKNHINKQLICLKPIREIYKEMTFVCDLTDVFGLLALFYSSACLPSVIFLKAKDGDLIKSPKP